MCANLEHGCILEECVAVQKLAHVVRKLVARVRHEARRLRSALGSNGLLLKHTTKSSGARTPSGASYGPSSASTWLRCGTTSDASERGETTHEMGAHTSASLIWVFFCTSARHSASAVATASPSSSCGCGDSASARVEHTKAQPLTVGFSVVVRNENFCLRVARSTLMRSCASSCVICATLAAAGDAARSVRANRCVRRLRDGCRESK